MWFFQKHKWKWRYDKSDKPQATSRKSQAPIFRKPQATSYKPQATSYQDMSYKHQAKQQASSNLKPQATRSKILVPENILQAP